MSVGEGFPDIPAVQQTSHHLKVTGIPWEIEVAAVPVEGPGDDTGDALVVAGLANDCLVRVQNRDDFRDHEAVMRHVNRGYASLFPMVREGAGVLVYLYKHGSSDRMAGGNGIVMYGRIRHLVDQEEISEQEAYERLGLQNELTYSNSHRLLQETLGLSAIRLLVSCEDDESTVQKIIDTLENNGDGLAVTPVSLENLLEDMRNEQAEVQEREAEPSRRRGARLRDLFRKARLLRR